MVKFKARMEQLFYTTGDTHPSVHSLSMNYLEKWKEDRQKVVNNTEIFFSRNPTNNESNN